MKRVVIIGCGFAGASAFFTLKRRCRDIEITVIDKKNSWDFLPMLPDVIGRKVCAEALSYPIEKLIKNSGARFINEEVAAIDLAQRKIYTQSQQMGYDYLIIAAGSETNFYGNKQIEQNSYKLDNVADAENIRRSSGEYEVYIISGGGYTGVEVATNIRRVFPERPIVIVERAPAILGPLPDWMKIYVLDNLKRLNISVFTNTTIANIEGKSINLSNGQSFNNTMLIWTAGVKTADFIQRISADKNPQGRLKVDAYLRLNDNCFVAGDAAYVGYKGIFLRMAIQFAIAQGMQAAKNVINAIAATPLKEYKPVDLGYIIPMANNLSCADVFGRNIKGRFPTMLHYIMCVYRLYGLRNKLEIIRTLKI